ncbi:hypothetical protein [Gaoshiqia sediminis]|uniref:Uncharacterized protein n=1 Tax=Gaoshiqia sediminis TaxID=2986998 RepID=A0AA41Y4I2_9BACT|nr:hypothetical protein [Gaoshiqia sediminis]MCW0481376.1 hypothetical protein [Gaoshiqia sediminis]
MIFDGNNLKLKFLGVGGLRQVSPGGGAKRNKRGDSCRAVQPGFGAKPSEKATGFVRGSERIKEAVERGGTMVPGHGDNL